MMHIDLMSTIYQYDHRSRLDRTKLHLLLFHNSIQQGMELV